MARCVASADLPLLAHASQRHLPLSSGTTRSGDRLPLAACRANAVSQRAGEAKKTFVCDRMPLTLTSPPKGPLDAATPGAGRGDRFAAAHPLCLFRSQDGGPLIRSIPAGMLSYFHRIAAWLFLIPWPWTLTNGPPARCRPTLARLQQPALSEARVHTAPHRVRAHAMTQTCRVPRATRSWGGRAPHTLGCRLVTRVPAAGQ